MPLVEVVWPFIPYIWDKSLHFFFLLRMIEIISTLWIIVKAHRFSFNWHRKCLYFRFHLGNVTLSCLFPVFKTFVCEIMSVA